MKKAAEATPNLRLAEERLRYHWSQREVAERVGTTTINVSRWERGLSTPGAYFRQQLCTLYGKSAEELGLVAQSVASEVIEAEGKDRSYWNVPYRRNPYFTSREKLLQELFTLLATHSVGDEQPFAISGLGGMGKTQVALEYAYRQRKRYKAVLWARADNRENLLADILAIAELVGLRLSDDAESPPVLDISPPTSAELARKALTRVKRWLSEQENWLLILDNVEDLTVIDEVLPAVHSGHVLLTTRTQIVGTVARQIEIEKMSVEEGTLFLLRRAKRLAPTAELTVALPALVVAAREIVLQMDGLPLALDQAGAYMEETACDCADYLERFRLRRGELLNMRGEVVIEHPASVAITFALALERVKQHSPLAADLLRLCAFLHADAIPEEFLLEATVTRFGGTVADGGSNALLFDVAMRELRKFSLLQRNPESRLCGVHRLVQAVIRDAMDEAAQRDWAAYTVSIVSRVFPNAEFATWQRCQRCLAHVQVCADLIEQWGIVSCEAAQLLLRAGRYVYEQASVYSLAEPFLRQSLAMYEQVREPEHAEVAQCLLYLGRIADEQGRYAEAEELFQRAVALQETIWGPEHAEVAQSLAFLVRLSMEQGRYAQVEPLSQRILRIGQQSAETDSLEVARHLNTLGHSYYFQGKFEQAALAYAEALAVREQELPMEHPDIAGSLANLGGTALEQGDFASAKTYYQRALAMYESVLQSGHPMIGLMLNTLARICYFMDCYDEAEPLFQRAIVIRRKALGLDSPCLAESLCHLAALCVEQGKLHEVEQLCERALSIYMGVWGEAYTEHLDVAQVYRTLATFYHRQGDVARAEFCFQQAHAIRQRVLGVDHPLVAKRISEWHAMVNSTV